MQPTYYTDTVIQLFAKVPLLGQVKTRMSNRLSAAQALQLHEELTRWTCRQLCRAGRADVELWVSAQPQHPFFQALCREWKLPVHSQCQGDLGEKMYRAALAGLQRKRFVVLVGADCPFVDGNYLDSAIEALHENNDAVVGPASDGGYVLLGLRAAQKTLFEAVPWGESQVLAVTEQRLAAIGWRYRLLAPQSDIDRPQDLSLLAAETLPAGLRRFAATD